MNLGVGDETEVNNLLGPTFLETLRPTEVVVFPAAACAKGRNLELSSAIGGSLLFALGSAGSPCAGQFNAPRRHLCGVDRRAGRFGGGERSMAEGARTSGHAPALAGAGQRSLTHVFHHNANGRRESALSKQEQVSKLARTERLEALAR